MTELAVADIATDPAYLSLLAGVLAEPESREPELILGDWLEDSGHEAAPLWRTPLHTPRAKVESLTAYQDGLLPAFRDHWLGVGLAIGPCDRNLAWTIAQEMYVAAGLVKPTIQIWMPSPLQGAIATAQLLAPAGNQVGDQVRAKVWDQVRDQVRAKVWDQVRGQVWAQVLDQVWAKVGDQVLDQVWAKVGDQVRDQVGAQVRDQVGAQVRDQVGDQVRDQVRAQVWDQVCYGQHDASWLAFYAYFLQVCRVEAPLRLVYLMRLARLVGWFWPLQDAVVFTERPVELEMSGGKLVKVVYGDDFTVGG